MDESEQAILDLLAPISLRAFLNDYWETQPLHVSRGKSDYYRALLSVDEIEKVLSTRPLYYPDVQVTQSGKTISPADYSDSDNQILPARLAEYHAQGATLILSRAQHVFSELADLCKAVSAAFFARCQTNVYLSAPGKQGFNAHYDTHDVFILQVSGVKTFNFYPSSMQLPLTDETFDPERIKPAAIDESVILEAGDTLYIPRGVVHDAIADESNSSLHVTLGIYPLLIKDLLQQMLQIAAEGNADFRRSVLDKTEDSHAMQQLILDSIDAENFNAAINRFKDELALDLKQDVRGQLGRAAAKPVISKCTSVVLRPDTILDHVQTTERIEIRMAGQIVIYEAHYQAAVEILLGKGQLCFDDVRPMSIDQYKGLISRLHKDNLIVFCE